RRGRYLRTGIPALPRWPLPLCGRRRCGQARGALPRARGAARKAVGAAAAARGEREKGQALLRRETDTRGEGRRRRSARVVAGTNAAAGVFSRAPHSKCTLGVGSIARLPMGGKGGDRLQFNNSMRAPPRLFSKGTLGEGRTAARVRSLVT